MNIAVLCTCYNRVDITAKGLAQLALCLSKIESVLFHIFLVDDGSSDGTTERLSRSLNNITIIQGSGNLYWNGGMSKAYGEAKKNPQYSHYLLFNDDLTVDLPSVLAFFRDLDSIGANECILVGATIDSFERLSYSAFLRSTSCRPLSFERLKTTNYIQRCDTFNGNFVLIPCAVMHELNGLDPKFLHGYGDLDLGLRATSSGIPVFLASTPVGICELNPPKKPSHTLKHKIADFLIGSWGKRDSLGQRLHFARRHASLPCFLIYATFITLRITISNLARHATQK